MDAVVEATGTGTVTVIGGAACELRLESGGDRFVDSRGTCPMVLRLDTCGNFSRQATLPEPASCMAQKTRQSVVEHDTWNALECVWKHRRVLCPRTANLLRPKIQNPKILNPKSKI